MIAEVTAALDTFNETAICGSDGSRMLVASVPVAASPASTAICSTVEEASGRRLASIAAVWSVMAFAELGETYKVQMLNGYKPQAAELFAMATIGNARRLHMASDTGSLSPGKFADVVVLDPEATPVLKARHELSQSLEDVLFALMILGDDRAIAASHRRC